MGNSIPDYNVFGKMAGISASEYAKKTKIGKLTLDHVKIGKRRWKEKE
jgi:succinate dehydrogenase/fumarate reductase flavoprotein subunit